MWRVNYAKVARRTLFLVLLGFYLGLVILSCLKWKRRNVGTFQEKHSVDSVKYPSLTLCFLPHIKKNLQKYETWTFPNATLDKVIEIKQRVFKEDG